MHRFTDPAYADLTVRMRAGDNPALLFDRLHALGLVQLHPSTEDARGHRHRDHEAIAATRSDGGDQRRGPRAQRAHPRAAGRRGKVDDTTTATGNDGLPIGAGDVIPTRKNDSTLGVANRQTWTVQSIGGDGTVWAIETASGAKHQRSVPCPPRTSPSTRTWPTPPPPTASRAPPPPSAHTVLSEALDASGVYVGMTRGRNANVLHIVADDLDDAREQFVDALQRDRADRGLQAQPPTPGRRRGAGGRGTSEVRQRERARLAKVIADAEQEGQMGARRRSAGRPSADPRPRGSGGSRHLCPAEAHLTTVRDEARSLFVRRSRTADLPRCAKPQAPRWTQPGPRGDWAGMPSSAGSTPRGSKPTRPRTRRDRWGTLPATSRWATNTRDGSTQWSNQLPTNAPSRPRCRPCPPTSHASRRDCEGNRLEAPRRGREPDRPHLRPTRRRFLPSGPAERTGPQAERNAGGRTPRCRSRRPRQHRKPSHRPSSATHRDPPGSRTSGRGHANTHRPRRPTRTADGAPEPAHRPRARPGHIAPDSPTGPNGRILKSRPRAWGTHARQATP